MDNGGSFGEHANGEQANGNDQQANGNGAAPQAALANIPGWVEKEVLDYSTMDGRSGEGAFDGSARIYEWNDEYGDIGPKIPEFEKELFGSLDKGDIGAGLDFGE